ncbi:MAG: hypothetical protein PUB61_05455, partial [Bacteroidales bacterium]|nr:hypothetical protein [Bacteroidales bacterium]
YMMSEEVGGGCFVQYCLSFGYSKIRMSAVINGAYLLNILIKRLERRLSNKFWAVSFYSFNRLKNKLKNKAFMLKFSVKAFVMS